MKQPLETLSSLNECWSMDFMSDTLTDGRKLRVFNIIDDSNYEAVAIDGGLLCPARAGVEPLENIKEKTGLPEFIRYDNAPEFR